MQRSTFMALGKVAGYLLLPCLFLLIPTRWFEAHPAPCLYRTLFRRRCPGCGMTRAFSCAAHGRFRRALGHNKLVVFALPLGLLAWCQGLTAVIRVYRRSAF